MNALRLPFYPQLLKLNYNLSGIIIYCFYY